MAILVFKILLTLCVFISHTLFTNTLGNIQTPSLESGECEYDLSVINDGPVTLDIPITFFAFLKCASPDEKYIYMFEDDAYPRHKVKVKGNDSSMASFVYPENLYKSGVYSVKVSAYIDMWKPFIAQVAAKNVTIFISKYITGILNLSNTMQKTGGESLYIGTGKLSNISVTLHYPQRIIEKVEISYSWTIEEDQFITVLPYIMYNFSLPRIYKIEVSAVARIPVYDQKSNPIPNIKYKWGYFKKNVIAKDPLYALNLTGNTYLQHGQLFNLDVSCNGSGPFEYCWKVFLPFENVSNLTCLVPVVTTTCSFPIIYYFHDSGNYQVAIFVDNYVNSIQRNVEVHIYDVSLRPQLSTVTIPLICTVLVILIIAAGILIHVHQNQNYDIETADFDFVQSEASVVESFGEKLYHSFLQFLYFRSRFQNHYLNLTSVERSKSNFFNQYGSVSE